MEESASRAIVAVARAGAIVWHLPTPRTRAALAFARWFRRRVFALGGRSLWPAVARAPVPAASPAIDRAQWEAARRAWVLRRPALTVSPERIAELARIGLAVVQEFDSSEAPRLARLQRANTRARAARAAATSDDVIAGLSAQLQRVIMLSIRAATAVSRPRALRWRRLGWLVLADVALQLIALSRVGLSPVVDALVGSIPAVARGLVPLR